jgi:hypothetical protein
MARTLLIRTLVTHAKVSGLVAGLAVAGLVVRATASEFTLQMADHTTRRVVTPSKDQVDLYMSTASNAPLWTGTYPLSAAPFKNPAGPVAGRNLLSWYGTDRGGADFWTVLGQEMKTNHAAEGVDTQGGCSRACASEPTCVARCTSVFANGGNKGTRQADLISALQQRAPAGYKVYFHTGRHNLADILEPLADGNPPIAGTLAPPENPFVVVTGAYKDSDGRTRLRITPSAHDWEWEQFVKFWSADNVSEQARRFMEAVRGDKPYFLAFYAKATDLPLGRFCTAHAECHSGLCDAREGAGCVPNHDGKGGDLCTAHEQCKSARCIVASGAVAGQCAVPSLGLGQPCSTHSQCASGVCDPRTGAGCVPNHNGNAGDFCTDHAQCRSRVCKVSAGKLAGKCN